MELQAAIGVLRRRWWVIGLGIIVGIVASLGVTASTPKSYRASSRLFVNLSEAKSTSEAVLGLQLTSQLLSSYARVVNSEATVNQMRRSLSGQLTPEQIRSGHITATPVTATVLIDISATDHDPRVAAILANAAAQALTTVIGDLSSAGTDAIKASIINRAGIPGRAVSPQPKKNLTVGALAGLAIGAAAALLLDLLDRSVRTPATAAEVFDAPFLGSIPRQRRLSTAPLSALSKPGSPTGESYRVLRTALRYRDASDPLKTILVTSAAAGDGKTTVAANLAIAMAQDGLKVILIDADFRRGRVAQLFDVPQAPGLSNVLLGKVKLRDALTSWGRGLSVLSVGSSGLNPSEALGSKAMQALLAEAKTAADVVIIDAPPVLPVTDPAVLSSLVDGTLIVCRWGRTSLHAAAATRQTLDNVNADVVGVVLNAEGGGRSADYYRHYSSRPAHRKGDRDADIAPIVPRLDDASNAADG